MAGTLLSQFIYSNRGDFSKKYLLFVEIQVFCLNIEILDDHALSIIFAKTDNSIPQKMAKLSIIDNNNFRYINMTLFLTFS
jgi:hypothetical protein